MRIGFYVGDVGGERPEYSTTRLALSAAEAGHEVFYADAEDFALRPDGGVYVRARRARVEGSPSLESFLAQIQETERGDQVAIEAFDVLMLRADLGRDVDERPWAATAELTFGGMAARAGVLVVNDPVALALAANKSYLQRLPAEIRPRTLITRRADDIKAFVEDEGGRAIIKPLHGSKGHSVFLVTPEEGANLNQMIEAVLRDGYATVQEYLPGADRGDVRVIVLDGEPLRVGDAYAAFRRVPSEDDIRSNMNAGGRAETVDVDDELLGVVDRAGPQLREDGMLLVGLDVIDNKVIEINAESPGGLGSSSIFGEVDFASRIVEVLEKKATSR